MKQNILLLCCTWAHHHVFNLDFISIDIIALRNICYAMAAIAIKHVCIV